MTFNGSRWVSADGQWVWDRGQWQKAHPRRRRWLIVLIVAVVAMPILGVVSGVTYLSVATDAQPMASIGGCPSTAFPLPAGSTVDEQAGLVSDWPPHTLGCWTANSEIGTEAAAFAFYMEPSNTPGWTVVYAYPQTRAARFSSVTHRGLFADVSVDSVHLVGHSKTRLDLSVCFCNPDRFVG